jgi:hypothetical protein
VRRLLIAIALLGSLAACGADAQLPPSPGVRLVQNATAFPVGVDFEP